MHYREILVAWDMKISSAIQLHLDKLFTGDATIATLMPWYQQLNFILCHLLTKHDKEMMDFSTHDVNSPFFIKHLKVFNIFFISSLVIVPGHSLEHG